MTARGERAPSDGTAVAGLTVNGGAGARVALRLDVDLPDAGVGEGCLDGVDAAALREAHGVKGGGHGRAARPDRGSEGDGDRGPLAKRP